MGPVGFTIDGDDIWEGPPTTSCVPDDERIKRTTMTQNPPMVSKPTTIRNRRRRPRGRLASRSRASFLRRGADRDDEPCCTVLWDCFGS